MSRIGAIFWLGTAMTACVVMFMINYAVQSLQDDLNKVRKQTIAEKVEIRVLNAEWSYLTQPERLAALNRQFLSLTPVATRQLQGNIAEIPLRPVAEPPAEAVASATPAPAQAAGLELPAARQSGLDALFAQASAEPQPAAEPQPTAALPATPTLPVASTLPVTPNLPVTKVALTTPARPVPPGARSPQPGIDALFALVASER